MSDAFALCGGEINNGQLSICQSMIFNVKTEFQSKLFLF